MKVEKYEKAFLWLGGLMLIVFMIALTISSVAMGIHLPGRGGEVDPATVTSSPPFDEPGVREIGPGQYEVVLIGQAWFFNPAEIRVPVGSEVTFVATTVDVIHGIAVEGTRVNMMLIPGQVARNTFRFNRRGEFNLVCHEYCGAGHHLMSGKVIVE